MDHMDQLLEQAVVWAGGATSNPADFDNGSNSTVLADADVGGGLQLTDAGADYLL
jgi:hypothetical protein